MMALAACRRSSSGAGMALARSRLCNAARLALAKRGAIMARRGVFEMKRHRRSASRLSQWRGGVAARMAAAAGSMAAQWLGLGESGGIS